MSLYREFTREKWETAWERPSGMEEIENTTFSICRAEQANLNGLLFLHSNLLYSGGALRMCMRTALKMHLYLRLFFFGRATQWRAACRICCRKSVRTFVRSVCLSGTLVSHALKLQEDIESISASVSTDLALYKRCYYSYYYYSSLRTIERCF